MKIFVMTPHGRFEVTNWRPEYTVSDVCQLNRIPPSAVSLYVEEGEGQLRLVTNLLETIQGIVPEGCSLVIRPDRNINYHEIIPGGIVSDANSENVTEYLFPCDDQSHLLKGFDSAECIDYVNKRVAEAIDARGDEIRGESVIVGVSGGGDSNALVGALVAAGLERIVPVMMLGIPDWDMGLDRAKEICASYELPLEVIASEEVGRLLGVAPGRDWVAAFEETYPDVDLEMLGTLAVRLALSSAATRMGARIAITGLNLEDLLAEAFMCALEGQPPLPFPRRIIGKTEFFYPMYKCPKKIIDGCFPKHSLANYEDRFPSRLRGRAIAYYLAQSMNGLIPGIEFDLIEGFSRPAEETWESVREDPDFGFATLRPVSKEAKGRWKSFLGT